MSHVETEYYPLLHTARQMRMTSNEQDCPQIPSLTWLGRVSDRKCESAWFDFPLLPRPLIG